MPSCLLKHVGQPASQSLAGYLDRWMKRGALRRQHALAAAQCLFGMLWFFLLTQELMGGKNSIHCRTKLSSTTVSRIFLDGAANDNKRTPSRIAAGRARPRKNEHAAD